LLDRAKRLDGEEAAQLFDEAEQKLAAAAKIDPARTYNIACLAALQGDEVKCRLNLEIAEEHRTLPSILHLSNDTDLNIFRDRPWFQGLLRRLKK
jgi:hypothetical protein